ncbi:MAG: hypothetical protein JW821_05490 [Deltaproteobacteria bacterium]|nr:hypothetical protein [Deltaproteobacteria bacterium]
MSALFERLASSMKPHPRKAQILIEVRGREDMDEVLGLLQKERIRVMEWEILGNGNPLCIMVYVPSSEMRTAVLRLSEAGYARVKGLNAPEGMHAGRERG